MTDTKSLTVYRDFRPTGFDPAGLNGDENGISDYLVVPVGRNRDSGIRQESNFQTALKMLGGESKKVQVHRFGHWGPGWFEIILVDPKATKKVEIAEEIRSKLEDYPLLDEDDYSRREYEDTISSIKSEIRFSFGDRELPPDAAEDVYRWLADHDPIAIESVDDGGGYPSEDELRKALTALKLLK